MYPVESGSSSNQTSSRHSSETLAAVLNSALPILTDKSLKYYTKLVLSSLPRLSTSTL